MRLGDVIWRQTIELRSRNHVSDEDDLRLAAIFRWTLRDMFSGLAALPRGQQQRGDYEHRTSHQHGTGH